MTLELVPVSGLAGLQRWEQAWRCLLAAGPAEWLFLQPEWVLPWLRTYQIEPRALIIGQGGQPLAGALLAAERGGLGGARVLRPPGYGVSDYLDLLLPAASAAAAAATERLVDWLLETGGWDLLDLPGLPAESPTSALLTAAAARRGLRCCRIATHGRPYLRLSGSWASYLGSRPGKLRYNLRARRRHLEALGHLRFERYRSPDAVQEQLPRAVEVHARRWRGQHTSTTFSSSPRAQAFYTAAAGGMAARGWLELHSLELEGRMIAFALCFSYGDKLFYYLPAFDPAFARFAPSTLLLAHLIESAFARGLAELDFMLGEESYKAQWASGTRQTCRLVIAAPNPRGALALAAFRAYLRARERARRSPLLQRARRYGIGQAKMLLGRLAIDR